MGKIRKTILLVGVFFFLLSGQSMASSEALINESEVKSSVLVETEQTSEATCKMKCNNQ